MRFTVSHVTEYRYSAPVSLTPHVLRLTPRPEAGALLSRALIVEPTPSLRWDEPDPYGNPLTRLAFAGAADRLRIESRFELETAFAPPDPAPAPLLPWRDVADAAAAVYCPGAVEDDSVRAFAEDLAAESGGDALVFLDRLTRTLFTRTNRHIRAEGFARTPAETLASATGACRDLTVLFMASCRSLGVPARFVSGYQAHAESVDGRRHLHAWPEAWLPGTGWRGYDPTHGLPVTDGHVALCAAPDQAETMPLEGGFYGDGVTSTLDYEVRIETGA